ncbi:cell envelope integrity protein CreD [Chitinophaga sp. 30R24]|uniref:cell envelope integrity protein CreD n=1 Tax=Chitinophaga sp. 30R24 TaxID=3248838 RepID=UPI003B8F35B2
MEPITHEPRSFFDRYAYAIKGALIIILTLVLLIPTNLIQNLIWERRDRQEGAIKDIGNRWGNEQNITGPVLAIPCKAPTGELTYAYLLPEQLKVNGELLPEKLHQGIFNVAVYNARLQLSGTFNGDAIALLNLPPSALDWEHASLLIGLSDLHGINNQVQMTWNGKNYLFNPGVVSTDLFNNGVQVPVVLYPGDTGALRGNFSLELNVRGSGRISFSPIGKTTQVSIHSSWKDPAFDEAFPPQNRKVDSKGFTAGWQVQHLNRSFPQSWIGKKFNIHTADFGIKLLIPMESYQMTLRAVKYALLIIGLTFFIFYFIELSQRRAFHPLQYMLIGLALCIFYILLISVSEQINFMMAYIIASILTIGLITVYTATAFKSARIAAGIGGALTLLYGFIYVIISAEDQALLMGSLGLFIILAVVMYLSTIIKWEHTSKNKTIHQS